MRIENWQSRLIETIEMAELEPHVYSQSDCLMRVAWNAAAILRSDDPRRAEILDLIEKYQGAYQSLSGANTVLRRDGLTPLKLVKTFFSEISVSRAGGGDIGVVREGRHLAFGTFCGAHLYLAAPSGNGILPRSTAIMAFEVD